MRPTRHTAPGQTQPSETGSVSPYPTPRLIPVTSWYRYHPWPSTGGLRHLIFNASSNGFDKVIRRVGRRVLINEPAFFQWADTEGGTK